MQADKYIAALDLGSSHIVASVARVSDNNLQVIYYKERPSAGIMNSMVFNPKKAMGPVKEALAEAEEELGFKIPQVVVNLPKCDVAQQVSSAKMERDNPDDWISEEEIQAIKEEAEQRYPLEDSEHEVLYGAVAQSFSCDEEFQITEGDIVGMVSKTLEGNFKLFIGRKSAVNKIDKIFKDLDKTILKHYFSPIPMARAVLRDSEMDNGVALVDFGGGATSVTIYNKKILRYYAAIPYGGKTITNDIKIKSGISEDLAENIKKAYGACMPDRLQTLSEKILQIEGDAMDDPLQIPVKYLSEVITARTKEIVDAVLYEIDKSGFSTSLRNGMVITGGAADLTNLAAYIKEVSGYNVKIGKPLARFSAEDCDGLISPSAALSIGMLLSAKDDGLLNSMEEVKGPAPKVAEEATEPGKSVDCNLFGEEVKTEEKKKRPGRDGKKRRGIITWQNAFSDLYNSIKNDYKE